jgi:hypothetical protein
MAGAAGHALDHRLVRFPFKIGQLTDVSHCNLQHHFYCNRGDTERSFARLEPSGSGRAE